MRPSSHASSADQGESMLADLRRAGLKMTPQRIALVREFAADESHPTAQALFERLRPAFPTMSFATVYNTLDALTRAGLSSTLRLGQAARFDPNTEPHHHAVCDVCGDVRDVPALGEPAPAPLRLPDPARGAALSKRRGARFQVRTVERIYRGTCAACAAKAGTSRGAPRS
jgi:Fur family peroxide stress response transcriptional regulator